MRRSRSPISEASPLAPTRLSPALAVTGFLMLIAVLLMANPWFGVRESVWPWTALVIGQNSVLLQVMLGLWVLTGFWCVLMAFTEARRVRAIVASGAAAVLIVQATGGGAGFVIEDYNLNNMLPMIGLGAGLLLTREASSRGLGRLLALVSVLLLLWAQASAFSDGASRLQAFFRDWALVLEDAGHTFEGHPHHLWWNLVPQLFVLVGAAAGLLAGLGVCARMFLLVGFLALLLGILMPMGTGVVLTLDAKAGAREVLGQVTGNLIGHGLLLWMLGVFAIRDLASSAVEDA